MTWDREVVSVCTAPVVTGPVSGGEPLASLGAPRREDLAAARGRGARTEAVAALADEFARLIGPFHVSSPADLGRARCLPCAGRSGSGRPAGPPRLPIKTRAAGVVARRLSGGLYKR